MRLVVTGGGTGGHVFPAIEVAQSARARGADVAYFGSLRGQEGQTSQVAGIEFRGFPAQPLWSLKTLRGWKSAIGLLKASAAARQAMATHRPDVVFSTGGYSAAPIMYAARKLGVPLVIHEQNSIPGRSNRIFAKVAASVGVTFHRSLRVFGASATRVGLPVRKELVAMAAGIRERTHVVVVGGSQGAQAVNAVAARAADSDAPHPWIHATGPSNFDAEAAAKARPGYRVEPYLDVAQMGGALASAAVVLGRAGASTMTEIAWFGLPSILVPLPSAMDDHQTENAREFEALGIATLLPQSEATPERVLDLVRHWREADPVAIQAKCAEWIVPDSTERILAMLDAACAKAPLS